jgi:DNA-binding IclR family transcriptional regulator
MADSTPGTMKSLRTGIRLLMEFAGEQRDFGVGELATRCGLSKSQVSKVLAAFAEGGLLVQDSDTRRYSVGARTFALGSRFVTYDPLCREAMPVMRELVAGTGHSARLSVLDGDHVMYLIGVEGPLFLDTGWRAGTWLPAQATSAGRVMLAFMDPDRASRVIRNNPARAITDRTVTAPDAIVKLLAQTRARGFASQRDETTPGLGTIAVPIFAAGQQVVGALGLAFPTHTVPPKQDAALAEILHGAARGLSQRVGCPVYPFGGGTRERGPDRVRPAAPDARPAPARRRTA